MTLPFTRVRCSCRFTHFVAHTSTLLGISLSHVFSLPFSPLFPAYQIPLHVTLFTSSSILFLFPFSSPGRHLILSSSSPSPTHWLPPFLVFSSPVVSPPSGTCHSFPFSSSNSLPTPSPLHSLLCYSLYCFLSPFTSSPAPSTSFLCCFHICPLLYFFLICFTASPSSSFSRATSPSPELFHFTGSSSFWKFLSKKRRENFQVPEM